MSESDVQRVNELLWQAYELPFTEAVAYLNEAVRLAEAAGETDLAFQARLELVSAASLGGAPEQAIPAFAWCLAKFKEDPARFSEYAYVLAWNFKYVLHGADEIVAITRQQVSELCEEMTALYQRLGYNLRPAYYLQFSFAVKIGDRGYAESMLERYQKIERDSMADCVACETDSVAEYLALKGNWEQMLEAAEPILSNRLACAEIPHRTLNNVLRPLSMLGRDEEADALQSRGYRLIHDNPVFLAHIGLQIAHHLHRRRLQAAADLVGKHLHWALETHQGRSKCVFYAAAASTADAARRAQAAIKFTFPSTFALFEPSGVYDLDALHHWFDNEHRLLAARFDVRNGNDYFSRELPESLIY